MRSCTNEIDTSVIRLAEGCPNIKDLNLLGCDDISDTSIIMIADCCHNLEILQIGSRMFTDAIFN
jgi:hypothetical protein